VGPGRCVGDVNMCGVRAWKRASWAALCAAAVGLFAVSWDHQAQAGWWGEAREDIPGRWVVDRPGRGHCELSFSGAPDIPYGSITATGFCPPIFVDLPRWWLAAPGVVIVATRRDEVLAQLRVAWSGRLEGKAVTGEYLLLKR
jgi:hypothetical protein